MAGLHLVTGYKGTAHITSADQGVLNAMTVGVGDYVFTKGRRFEAEIRPNNVVRIYDGSLMMNGRQVNLDAGEALDAIIANGTQGMNRHDIIAIRYEINRTTGIESVSLVVGQGTPSAGTPTDPEDKYTESILNGVTVREMKLYRVVLEGLTITKVEPLFQVLAPMAEIQHGFYKQNMLINGDFQCNQRNNKTYEVTGTTQVAYSVDMWRIHQLKLEKLNEGVKITGNSASGQGYLTQFIQLGKLETTTYTISAMVDDEICTFTVTPGGAAKEKDFGKFKISALTTSIWDNALNDYNNKLKINICPVGTNTITIKYVDVFEGEFAYTHVKEDPATAMMRCRRYVQRGSCFAPFIYYEGNEHMELFFGFPFDPMASEPNLTACSWTYYVKNVQGSIVPKSGNLDDIEGITVSSDGRVKITLWDAPQNDSSCSSVATTYVLSCEHNPNGDS